MEQGREAPGMEEAASGQEPQDQANGASSSLPPGGMGDWLAEHEQSVRQWRRGEVVEGVVVSADRDEFLVDIGAKSEAVVPLGEVPQTEVPSVGETVLAYVLSSEDQEGRVVLSLTRARAERGWRNLQKRFEDGQTVEGEVVEHNKGGLVVNVEGVRGFVPLSQIADLRRAAPDESVEARLEAMKGRTLLLKVIEMNRRRNRLILSERAALQERRAREKDRLLAELQPGDTRSGDVSSICDFGAFVDLGGADGLVHLSELSWGQVSHPSQVVKVGDEVEVYVVGVDRENKKIALCSSGSRREPWSRVNEQVPDWPGRQRQDHQAGGVRRVRRDRAGRRGADPHLGAVRGADHPPEAGRSRGRRACRCKIIRIEPTRHRLGLSLRQVEEEPYDDYDGRHLHDRRRRRRPDGEDAARCRRTASGLTQATSRPSTSTAMSADSIDGRGAQCDAATPTRRTAEASSVEPSGARAGRAVADELTQSLEPRHRRPGFITNPGRQAF